MRVSTQSSTFLFPPKKTRKKTVCWLHQMTAWNADIKIITRQNLHSVRLAVWYTIVACACWFLDAIRQGGQGDERTKRVICLGIVTHFFTPFNLYATKILDGFLFSNCCFRRFSLFNYVLFYVSFAKQKRLVFAAFTHTHATSFMAYFSL